MTRTVHTLTVPSSTHQLEKVRRFVETHAQAAAFSEADVEQVRVAVDEACTNVIEHAYAGGGDHSIDLTVIITPDRFTVCIRDRGRAFDPSGYREPDILEFARHRHSGGLGVHLMHRLMDDVKYRSHGATNEVCLTKYRDGR